MSEGSLCLVALQQLSSRQNYVQSRINPSSCTLQACAAPHVHMTLSKIQQQLLNTPKVFVVMLCPRSVQSCFAMSYKIRC